MIAGPMRPALAVVSFLPLLAGCNAVLGIHPPQDWDGAAPGNPHPGADGSVPSGTTTSTGTGTGSGTGTGGAAHPFADWPMPNPPSSGLPNPQSYDVSRMPGIVVDGITGLEWQRTLGDSTYAWSTAGGYCAGLMIPGAGTGFRLPSRIELLSIVDFTQPGPLIDSRAFPDTPSDYFWTSSPDASDASKAWSVHFGFGTIIASSSPTMSSYHVRCVR
jgi:hypothetical protein